MRRVLGLAVLCCSVLAFTAGKPSSAKVTIHNGSWQLELVQTDSLLGVNQTPTTYADSLLAHVDSICVDISHASYLTNGDATHYGYAGSIYNVAPVGDSVSVYVVPCPAVNSNGTCVVPGTVTTTTIKADLNGHAIAVWNDDINVGGGVLSHYKMFIVKNADKKTKHGYHVIIEERAR